MTEEQEVTRKRIHELADTIQAVALKTAVIEERQSGTKAQLDRIEAAVTTLPQRVAILETRENDARAEGAKWGGWVGAFMAAVISGVSAYFSGSQR